MDVIWSLDELREHREFCAADCRQLMERVAALRDECAEVSAASERARSTAASLLAEHQVLREDVQAGVRQLADVPRLLVESDALPSDPPRRRRAPPASGVRLAGEAHERRVVERERRRGDVLFQVRYTRRTGDRQHHG